MFALLLTTLGTLSPSHIYPPPALIWLCTCLVEAAVGGRALAVSGTFQRRSHPVNPLGLGQTAPHLLPSHLHYLQYPRLPPSLSLVVLCTRFPLSALVRLKWNTAMSKLDTENEIKGQVTPLRMHTNPPPPRPRGFNPPKYSRMEEKIMSKSVGLFLGRKNINRHKTYSVHFTFICNKTVTLSVLNQ